MRPGMGDALRDLLERGERNGFASTNDAPEPSAASRIVETHRESIRGITSAREAADKAKADLARATDPPDLTTSNSNEDQEVGKSIEQSEEARALLEKHVAWLNEKVKWKVQKDAEEGLDQDEFTLIGPATLTVLIGAQYSKRPHIGMEAFTFANAYLGKRGNIIYQFKPVMAGEYSVAELAEMDATKELNGFREFLTEIGANTRREEVRTELQRKRDAEQIAQKADAYSDAGFGSW